MPLKIYLDGSQTDGAVTMLGAVVAEESVWPEVERAWDDALRKHGVPYSHMKELTGRIGPFKGWGQAQVAAFAKELVSTLEGFKDARIRQYGCWVDLKAHRKWARIRHHPSPERLCARILFPTFVQDFPGLIDAIDAWFDQGERFMTHLREDWQNPKIRRSVPVWSLVRTIAPADMRTTPPLQVADLIAWSRNRYAAISPILETRGGIDELSVCAARVLNHGIKGVHKEAGEQAMAESTFPEEGLRRRNLFERARKRHV